MENPAVMMLSLNYIQENDWEYVRYFLIRDWEEIHGHNQ